MPASRADDYGLGMMFACEGGGFLGLASCPSYHESVCDRSGLAGRVSVSGKEWVAARALDGCGYATLPR